MREIKFRIFLGGVFRYWGFIDGGFNGIPEDSNEVISLIEKEQKCQQYTGIKDKNGKEIYEGDLFGKMGGDQERPYKYEIHAIVYFDEYLGAFCIDDNRGGWEYLSDYLNKQKNEREVIGNIYENSNLLKKL